MFETIFNDWLAVLAAVLLWGTVTAPGEILFGPEKQSIVSRLRWALFWTVSIFIQTVCGWAIAQVWQRFGVSPAFVLDFKEVGEHLRPELRTGFLICATIAAAFINDFLYYWFHRMQHAVPFLWRFHAVHHSIEEMNCMNSAHHWTEGILHSLFITLPIAVLFALRLDEVLIITVVVGAWTQFVHANSSIDFGPLRWVLVSPRSHRLHHSSSSKDFDRNFAGVFSIIDVMFGTGKFPFRGEQIAIGLPHKNEPKTLLEFLFALRDKS